jgi:hypothetical protein
MENAIAVAESAAPHRKIDFNCIWNTPEKSEPGRIVTGMLDTGNGITLICCGEATIPHQLLLRRNKI